MKTKVYTFLIILIFSLYACDDFLEETSQDLVVPTKVEQFSEILFADAYQKKTDIESAIYLELMTDDVSGFDNYKNSDWAPETNYEEKFFGYYTWQKNPQRDRAGNLQKDPSWEWFYKSILVCNIIIQKIEKKEMEGAEDKKNNLLAEAHFLRAWNYFNLVNLYGEPYGEASAKSDLGVPINNLTIATNTTFKRASVAENYNLIESNLDKAITNFKKTTIKNNYFRGNLAATYLLASRVALYQKKYDKVIEYVKEGLEIKADLANLETLEKTNRFSPFITPYNSEILFTYGSAIQYGFNLFSRNSKKQIFGYSQELRNMYNDNDVRHKYFSVRGNERKNLKINASPSNFFSYGLRTAEFYLNRAEAYIEKGDATSGMEDINTVRAARYYSDTEYELTDTQKARELLREERRREFCFEGHRWFDIRRWGLPVERTYLLPDGETKEIYQLQENDPAYTLPIPEEVRLTEPNLERITRPIRSPQ